LGVAVTFEAPNMLGDLVQLGGMRVAGMAPARGRGRLREMARPVRVIVLAVLFAASGGCAFLDEQVRISSTSSCVSKTCRGEPDAPGYQQCEAACRGAYGR
jgi:hypothetical protein